MKNKQEKQAPNKWGSWELFVIAIGTLVIVTAPMYDKPIIVVIEGLSIVLIGVLWIRLSRKKHELGQRRKQTPRQYKKTK